MKLIRTKKYYLPGEKDKDGKFECLKYEDIQEIELENILTFECDENGEKLMGIEDRILLLQNLMSRVIVKNPEIFEDYLASCSKYSSSYGVEYKIENK